MSDKPSGHFRINATPVNVMTAAVKLGMRDLEELCGIMTELARQKTPVKTGKNRRSIGHTVRLRNDVPVATVFTSSGYGGWLEIGTSKMEARPYMAPAFDTAREVMRQKVAKRSGGL